MPLKIWTNTLSFQCLGFLLSKEEGWTDCSSCVHGRLYNYIEWIVGMLC